MTEIEKLQEKINELEESIQKLLTEKEEVEIERDKYSEALGDIQWTIKKAYE